MIEGVVTAVSSTQRNGWWWNRARTSLRLPNLWWGKRSKRSLFASYLQEIALAKIVLLCWGHERDGMAVAIISPVPRRAACLWSGARAGQEGRRWAGEGRQPLGGLHHLGLANGPAAISLVCRYAGRRCSCRRQGILNRPGADDCETRAATLPTSLPLSTTIHLSSSHLPQWSEANGAWTAVS